MTRMLSKILAVFALVSASVSNAAPLEQEVQLQKPVTRGFAIVLGDILKGNGYPCESVSSVSLLNKGYSVTCSDNRFQYEVLDVGGEWRILIID